MKKFDLTGKKFNQLTVIEYSGKDRFGKSLWLCECSCENKTRKIIRGIFLTSGKTKTCGCIFKQMNKAESNPNYKHGHTTGKISTEYYSWSNMISRCENENNEHYNDYGGRGIEVCERWKAFENFIEDMGNKPTTDHSIERTDVNGNYEPSNCKWATIDEQSKNKRVRKSSKTGIKGVYFSNINKKYVSYIGVNNKRIHLGYFDNLYDAEKARKDGENKYWFNNDRKVI